MKSFKQMLMEAVKIMSFKFFSGPISSDARNVNMARKELYDLRGSSQGDEDETNFRALYDFKTKKIWLWYSIDGLHDTIAKYLKLNAPLHLIYHSDMRTQETRNTPGTVNAPGKMILVAKHLNDNDKKTIVKWFGKNKGYIGAVAGINKREEK